MCSVPEPDPKESGVEVTAPLLEHVKDYRHVVALIRERHAFGLKKYGQPLMSLDGRNGLGTLRVCEGAPRIVFKFCAERPRTPGGRPYQKLTRTHRGCASRVGRLATIRVQGLW